MKRQTSILRISALGMLTFASLASAGPLEDILGAAVKAAAQQAKANQATEPAQQASTGKGQQTAPAESSPQIDEALIAQGWDCFSRLDVDGERSDTYHEQRNNPYFMLAKLDAATLHKLLDEDRCRSLDEKKIATAFRDKYIRFNLFQIRDRNFTDIYVPVLSGVTFETLSAHIKKIGTDRLNGSRYKISLDLSVYTAERPLREKKKQQLQEQKQAEQQRIVEARNADLRAGKTKPTTLQQAAIAFRAESGNDLASAPKIRPDGKMYAFHGVIEKADNAPEFIAYVSPNQSDEELLRAMGRSRPSTAYFKVKIPKAFQTEYFDHAKVGGGFDLVGKYIGNIPYTTVAGQEKQAPIFEAVYFTVWKKR